MACNPYLKRILLWAVWIAAGCVFYTLNLKISYSKGLYYSVLVGYNIGWNFEEDYDTVTEYYSIGHMIVGICAVTVLLEEYIQNILNSDTQWYKVVIERENYDNAPDFLTRMKHGFNLHKYTIVPSIIWVGVLVVGSIMAYTHTEWSITDSCFFTTSTLFAGGFAKVPDDFSNFQYFCVSIYAATGVPLTMYCFSSIAAIYVSSPHSTKFATVCKSCDVADLKTMQKLNLENCDGHLDKAEYIILCMLRLRAIDPELVEAINRQFNALDLDKNGFLEYAELLELSTITKSFGVSEDDTATITGDQKPNEEKGYDLNTMNDDIQLEIGPCNLESRFSENDSIVEVERSQSSPESGTRIRSGHPLSNSVNSTQSELALQTALKANNVRQSGSQLPEYRPKSRKNHHQINSESKYVEHKFDEKDRRAPLNRDKLAWTKSHRIDILHSSVDSTDFRPPPPPHVHTIIPPTAKSLHGVSAGLLLAQRVAAMKKEMPGE